MTPTTSKVLSLINYLLFIFLSFGALSAWAVDRSAKVYELGKTNSSPLFFQKMHLEKNSDGFYVRSTVITDAQGKVALTETGTYQGTRLISQRVDQLQIGEAYEAEVKDQKVFFKTYKTTKAGLILDSTDSEKIGDNFISGPLLEPYLQKEWQSLEAGKTVSVRFGVLERGDTVGFKFRISDHGQLNGRETVTILMKPTSIFVSAVVRTIEMVFDASQKNILRFKGRTPLFKKVGEDWEPFEAEVVAD